MLIGPFASDPFHRRRHLLPSLGRSFWRLVAAFARAARAEAERARGPAPDCARRDERGRSLERRRATLERGKRCGDAKARRIQAPQQRALIMKSFAIVAVAVIAHAAIGRWVSAPWLVPDLTSLATLVAILRLPGHPVTPAIFAAAAATALAVHHPAHSGAAYLLGGALAKWLAHQWDLTQPATERLIVAMSHTVVILVLLSTVPSPARLLGWAALHVALTLACLPLMQLIIPRPAPDA